MSIFSSKKKVYVASSTWNLLGDQDPINFLSYNILDAKLKGKEDISKVINAQFLTGPAMLFRRFMRWAKRSKYNDIISLATSIYYDSPLVDRAQMAELLKTYLNTSDDVYVKEIFTGTYDYTFYGKQWIYQNYPDELLTNNYKIELVSVQDHQSHYDEQIWVDTGPNDGGQWENHRVYYWVYREDISITLSNGITHVIDSRPINNGIKRLYAEYELTHAEEIPKPDGKPEDKPEIQYTKKVGILIYSQGDGYSPFDNLFSSSVPIYNSYAPFIPLRTWNQFISNDKNKEYLPEVYEPAKKATEKALGDNKYDDLIKACADNKQIGDIDFIYLSFGCPLNTPYQAGRKYIYQFFYNLFMGIANRPESKTRGWIHNLFGQYRDSPRTVQIKSTSSAINYDIWLEWGGLEMSTSKSGLCRPYAKPNHYYFWSRYVEQKSSYNDYYSSFDYEITYLAHQKSSSEYSIIEITNLCQANLIYKGKSVVISGGDALGFQYKDYYYSGDPDDPDDEDTQSHEDLTPNSDPQTPDKDLSGFIVPLQYNTIMDMNLNQANNLIQECHNLIFNCYVVKKIKWYKRGAFKFVLAIVAIIITVVVTIYSGPAGGAASSSASSGLSSSVGGSIVGISDVAAATFIEVFAAVSINVAVTLVITTLITKLAMSLFGDKVGTIIGAIASIIVSFGVNNWGDLAGGLEQILSDTPTLLLNLGSLGITALNTYNSLLGLKTAGIYDKMMRHQKAYQDKMEEIEDKMKELEPNYILKYLFNADILDQEKIPYQTRDMFLNRTLMVGSDIRDLNLLGIHNMADITLEPQLT